MADVNKIKKEISDLISEAKLIELVCLLYENKHILSEENNEDNKKKRKELFEKMPDFKQSYHIFYAKAQRTMAALAPERLEEFNGYYTGNKNLKNSKSFDLISAGITHYLQGITITKNYCEKENFYGKFQCGLQQQYNILEAINTNSENILFNLESEIHYGVLKSEINVAKYLKKQKLLRPAGAVAGVVIEGHLKTVSTRRNVSLRNKNPCISDYNDALKEGNIIDVSIWRLIQRCADIRNYCVHIKERDPTPDEVDDLIRGAEKIIGEIS